MQFDKMAREHWEKYLPTMTKGLKIAGIFEREVQTAAEAARTEYAALVSSGMKPMGAKEIVLKEYIFLPPEIID